LSKDNQLPASPTHAKAKHVEKSKNKKSVDLRKLQITCIEKNLALEINTVHLRANMISTKSIEDDSINSIQYDSVNTIEMRCHVKQKNPAKNN